MIEVDGLTRHFGEVTAVDEIAFDVPEASICGFIGPNGAGKTTTMRILATLDVPSAGRATIKGHDVVEAPDVVRKHIGFMPDYYGTYTSMSVLEYLDFFARAYRLRGEGRRKRVAEIAAFTEVESFFTRPIDGLSKGQRQRLSLARALLSEPALLILDEPAAGLDPRARVELRELLKVLAQRGTTIFISSHILSELADLIDRVVIVDQGRVRYTGALDGLEGITQGARYELEIVSDPEAARRFLLEQAAIVAVDGVGGALSITLDEKLEAVEELIARAIGQGLRFRQFYRRKAQLEDAFLAVTQGESD